MTILTSGQNIYLRQGDTGNLTFQGLPADKKYTAYLSIYNEETNAISKEFKSYDYKTNTTGSNGSAVGVAYFKITAELSNSLEVGEWKYGLKVCATDANGLSEDTVIPRSYKDDEGNIINEEAPTFTVDYKYVEGVVNNG